MASGLQLTFDLKKAFIDRQKINRAAERAEARSMVKSLAFIRRRARTNVLRRRKKVSRPGQPPSVRSRDSQRSLKFILFAYDRATNSGVVGPVKLSDRSYAVQAQDAVPGTLEKGGVMVYSEESVDGKRWRLQRRSRRDSRKKQKRRRRVQVQPRPFMSVALEREMAAGTIMTPWANVL